MPSSAPSRSIIVPTLAGTMISFSIDNGTSFASRGELEVTLDAEALTTLAQDITHIRWTFDAPIEPGVSGTVSFRGILN